MMYNSMQLRYNDIRGVDLIMPLPTVTNSGDMLIRLMQRLFMIDCRGLAIMSQTIKIEGVDDV
jgi:hypothetical protein